MPVDSGSSLAASYTSSRIAIASSILPRILPLHATMRGNGNNAYFDIVAFVGVTILDADLTGAMSKKYVKIQPCYTGDGTAIDVPVKGYVAGEDGKAGMRGRLVSKQGQILANALLAGVASGIGHAFTQSSTTLSVSPLGTTSTVDPGKQLEAGLGTGVGKALDRLAQYYISLAEKVFPVIEVDAGRSVDVVLTQGVALPGTLDAAGTDPDNLAQLAERARTLRRNDDEDD